MWGRCGVSGWEAEDTGEADAGRVAPAPALDPPRWRIAARRSLVVLFLAAVVAAVAVALRGQDWSALGAAVRQRPLASFVPFVVAAFIANAASVLLTMVSWREMLSGLGDRVGAPAAARIFFVGQFAKFVPGKLLGLVVVIRMGRAIGVPAARMAYAWLLSVVVILLSGATVGLLAGPYLAGASVVWLAVAAAPIAGVLVRPDLVGRVAALAARLSRRPRPVATVSGRSVRLAVLVQTLAWLLGGVHLWALALAMGAAPARSLLLCLGSFGLGTVAGMLAVFAPEGVGVREVVLLAALGVTVPLAVAGVVVLVSRLVVTLSELTTAGTVLLLVELRRRRPAKPHRLAGAARKSRPDRDRAAVVAQRSENRSVHG
jgi:glycosyltransferase 2 family protein